jgi:hypothetical protein
MGITVEQVETIAAKLRALPPVENRKRVVSKQESIRMLIGEIAALRERGYTLEQVAELLTADHLEIGAPTLKSYLQRSRPSSTKATGKRKTTAVRALPSSVSQAKPASEAKQPAQTIEERASAALAQSPGNTTSAAAAITRPDRSRI